MFHFLHDPHRRFLHHIPHQNHLRPSKSVVHDTNDSPATNSGTGCIIRVMSLTRAILQKVTVSTLFCPQAFLYLQTYSTGRLVTTIAHYYAASTHFERISDDISCSNLNGISLADYIYALPRYCHLRHDPSCTLCPFLLTVASDIINNGFVLLSSSFRSAFPSVTYHSPNGKRSLWQIPLVPIRFGQVKSGCTQKLPL